VRILYVSNGYPPHRWAGTENHTAGIAREFQRRGADVRVLCAGGWDAGVTYFLGCEDSVDDGVRVRRLNVNWTKAPDPFVYLYDNPVAGQVLDDLLEEFTPDLVHVTSCETLSARVLAVVKRRKLPLVLSLTDFWFLCPRINLLRHDGENCSGLTTAWECTRCLARESKAYRWPRMLSSDAVVGRLLAVVSRFPRLTRHRGLRGMIGNMEGRKAFLRSALAIPDVRITASPFVRRVHEENGITVPIDVRPYGHDLSWLASFKGREPSPVLRLGFVGQILPSKGVHVLLDAVSRLGKEYVDRVSVQVYGDLQKSPAYSEQLAARAAALPNVRFMGTYAFADSARVYAGFDVLIVPSLWYDFPLVIHEALASKAPVVATDLGGMAEAVVHDRNGLLFARGDASGLAAQLRRLADEAGLLDRLRHGIAPIKTKVEECDELEETYRRLTAAANASRSAGRA
jgi:glycosyltransferase involved in cell wall biosynthesis